MQRRAAPNPQRSWDRLRLAADPSQIIKLQNVPYSLTYVHIDDRGQVLFVDADSGERQRLRAEHDGVLASAPSPDALTLEFTNRISIGRAVRAGARASVARVGPVE
jgi:hypothetical protein